MRQPISIRSLGIAYLLFIILCFFALKPGLLILDGLAYYSYLPSLFLDGDLNFWNEFKFGGVLNETSSYTRGITESGYVSNHWSVGPASLWWPFWAAGHLLTRALGEFHHAWPLNGFSFYYNVGVRFATAILGLSTLIVTFLWLRKSMSKRSVLTAVLLIAFGTPFFWYSFTNADMSHVPAAFAITLFLSIQEYRRYSGYSRFLALGLGFIGGLVTLVRMQDGIIFVFLLLIWAQEIRTKSVRFTTLAKEAGWVALSGSFMILLQFFVWQIVFGHPLGGLLQKYYIFSGHFHAYDIFFSSYHGIFFFTPILLFSFVGLLIGASSSENRITSVGAITVILFQLLLMSHERWFWEGTSFGMRRLVDWTPLFIFGLGMLLDRLPRLWIHAACGVAALWTILLNSIYSIRPMFVLFDYQPPSLILEWVVEFLRSLPRHIPRFFMPAAPLDILLLALVFFVPIGFLTVVGIVRFVEAFETKKARRILAGYCLIVGLVATMYTMTIRAAMNGAESKAKYAVELSRLKQQTESGYRSGIAEHIFSEAKFLALYKGWEPARKSFQEALRTSPRPDSLRVRISAFVRQHLSQEETRKYVANL